MFSLKISFYQFALDMLSVTRKLTLGLRRSSRLFSSGNPRPSSSSKFFDDRTLGIITLLVSVPTVLLFNHLSIICI